MAEATNPAEAVELMKQRFNASAAEGVDGILQFDLTGDPEEKWAFKISGGAIEVVQGGVDAPTTNLKISADDFVALTNGTLNGMTAFMSGKIKLEGDMALAMKFQNMFPVS